MSTIEPYDVTVVGAGLAGALVASTLAEEGLKVVVLEATRIAGGTVKRQPGLALLGTPEPFTQAVERRGDQWRTPCGNSPPRTWCVSKSCLSGAAFIAESREPATGCRREPVG